MNSIVLITTPTQGEANNLTQRLLKKKLAACINLLPVTSHYWWKDKIEHEQEYLLLIKTTTAQMGRLQAALRELHPYELPECVELAIDGGTEQYLGWLAGEVE
jgi:periplasmic divalent cation tolerance protein